MATKTKQFALAMSFLVIACIGAAAKTVYVNKTYTPPPHSDGTIDHPYTSIQEAVDELPPSPFLSAGAGARTIKWTGEGGDGEWENEENWEVLPDDKDPVEHAVPTKCDNVIIPANKGTITTDGGWKEVKSLRVQDSVEGETATVIKSREPNKRSTKIRAYGTDECPDDDPDCCEKCEEEDGEECGDIYIGEHNTVCGKDGERNGGGDVILEAKKGDVTNAGHLQGGKGGYDSRAGGVRKGGKVKVTGKSVVNTGTEQGGEGGDWPEDGRSHEGGEGGDVENHAKEGGTVEAGTKLGGEGGHGNPDDEDHRGPSGEVLSVGAEGVVLGPGYRQQGSIITLSTGPGGRIQLSGIQDGALVADQALYINAGGPGNPIEMFDIEPGAVPLQAGEYICLHGEVIMDEDRSLEEISEPDAIISPEPCLPPPGPFLDDFDDYDLGDVCGQGGWEEWDGSSDVCGQVTDAHFWSSAQSLLIEGAAGPAGDDTVKQFEFEGGLLRFQTRILIPEDAAGHGYVILLNQYPAREYNNWSLQITLDADEDQIFNRNAPAQRTELRRGEWVNLVALIDLDADLVQVFYAGERFVSDRSWRNGVEEGGMPWMKALDLYGGEPDGNGITAAYFDDVRVDPFDPTYGACCVESVGVCTEDVHEWDCDLMGGFFYEGHTCGEFDPPCGELGCTRDPEWGCDGDVDGDGQVNPVDAGLVQSAFGSTDEQDLCNYDVDCDGQINPVDAGIVQSLFGTCDAPRAVCP